MDQATGKSRGFCFVSFREELDARTAQDSLNGQVGGREGEGRGRGREGSIGGEKLV